MWCILLEAIEHRLSIVRSRSCSTIPSLPVTWVLSISVSTIPRNLQTVRTTLTALRIFGIKQNVSCANTTELIANPSRCSWKNANFGLTSAHRLNSLKFCGIGVEFRANLRQPHNFWLENMFFWYKKSAVRNLCVFLTALYRKLSRY